MVVSVFLCGVNLFFHNSNVKVYVKETHSFRFFLNFTLKILYFMLKILLLFSFFLLAQSSLAQIDAFRCYITVSLNDCVGCLNASKTLDDIPKEFQSTLVFKAQYRKQAAKIVSEVLKISWTKENIIISDSLFNLLVPESTPYSEIHILDKNGYKFFTCKLKALNGSNNLDKIINLAKIKAYNTERVLPDSVLILDNLNLKYKNGHQYIFGHDRLLNRTHIFYKNSKKLYATVEGKNIDRKEVYKARFGDTAKYYQRITAKQKNLEAVGKTSVEIINFLDDKEGNIYAWLSVYYAFDSLKTTYVTAEPIFALLDKKGKYLYFNKKKVSDTFKIYTEGGYSSDVQVVNKKMYIMPNIKKDIELDSTISILAEIDLENKKPIELKKVYFPIIFKPIKYFYISYKFLYPYLFHEFYPQFTNVETGEKVKIQLGYEDKDFKEFRVNPAELIFEIMSIIEVKNIFYALIRQNKDYFYISIDKKGQVLSKELLHIPTQGISYFAFTDKDELVAINNEGFLITISLK